MADRYGKRSRDPSDDGERPIKREHQNSNQSSKMVEDFLESMDPSVRIKLRSMFDDGLLMYSDLDERNITELSKFDASVALETLEHYCSGDLSQVRNRRAYLAGAIRRRATMVRDNFDDRPLAPDGLPLLVPPVQRRFDDLKQSNPKVAELDQRSMDALAALPPSRALMALDRFGTMDFSAVRNPSALFMSIVRNVMEHEDDRPWGGRERDWGPPMGGGFRERRRPPIYGAPAPQPPPPPRAPPASQYAAAPAGLPPGTIITPGLNGGLVIAGTAGAAAVAGGLTGLSGLQAALAAPAAAAAPGLVLTAAPTAAGGVPQYMLVSTSSAQGMHAAAGQQVLAVPGIGAAASVLSAPQGVGVQQAAAAAPAAVEAAVPAGVPADWAAGRKNHGAEQGQLGVRVAEFHDLSPFAVYVNPSPALKLQSLWDSGNELVSMLDDKVWQVLAEMPAPEALAAIQEAADALDNPQAQIRNINAFFMSSVKKVWPAGMAHRGPGSGPGSGDHHHQAPQRGPPWEGYGAGRGSGAGYSRGGGGGGGGGGDHWGGAGGGPAAGGGGDKPQFSREPAIHLLPPEQRLLAEQLCQQFAPLLREEHFDEGVIACLGRLSHEDGVAVLKELGQNSMTSVRNMPGYIMGIAKRYSTGQRGSGNRQ